MSKATKSAPKGKLNPEMAEVIRSFLFERYKNDPTINVKREFQICVIAAFRELLAAGIPSDKIWERMYPGTKNPFASVA